MSESNPQSEPAGSTQSRSLPVTLSQSQASDLLRTVMKGQDDYAPGEAMKVLRTALLLLEQLGLVKVEG